ncbi:MAG: hypothetical protein ACTSYA_04135 [Candidatus Kariarchaeaceae archaeon]
MKNITIIRLSAVASNLILVLTAILAVLSAYNDVGMSVLGYFWIHLIFIFVTLPLAVLSMRTMPFPKFLDSSFFAQVVISFIAVLITGIETNLVFAIILMVFQALTMYALIKDRAQRKLFMNMLMGE